MSDSVKVILNDQINVSADRAKLLRVGGTQVSYLNQAANGSILGGSILFSNLALPSLANSCISRNMRITYKVQISAAAGTLKMFNPNVALATTLSTGAGGAPIGALRPFPLSCCTDTLILSINNTPVSVSLRQMMSGIQRTFPKEFLEKTATECPSQLDNSFVLATDNCTTATTILPTSSQPLSTCFNSPYSVSRASFAPVSYVAGSATGTITPDVAIFQVTEPVICPPLSLNDDELWLFNCNTLSIQYNYSQLNDMVCYGADAFNSGVYAYPAGFAVTLIDNSAKLAFAITSIDTRTVAVPRVVSYPYSMPQFFPTVFPSFQGTVSTGAVQNTGQLMSQSLRLSYMPSLLMIYAQVPPSVRASLALPTNAPYPDAFYSLGVASGTSGAVLYNPDQTNVISIQLNNRQGLLAGASIKDLYRLTCANQWVGSYNDWLQSPIIILNPSQFGIDVGASDIYPSQNGNVTLSIQASFNTSNMVVRTSQLNAGGWAQNPAIQLQILAVQDGIFQVSPDSCVIDTGALSATEVKVGLEDASAAESLETAFVPASVEKLGHGGKLGLFGAPRSVVSGVARGMGGAMSGGAVSGGRARKR